MLRYHILNRSCRLWSGKNQWLVLCSYFSCTQLWWLIIMEQKWNSVPQQITYICQMHTSSALMFIYCRDRVKSSPYQIKSVISPLWWLIFEKFDKLILDFMWPRVMNGIHQNELCLTIFCVDPKYQVLSKSGK